MKGSIKFSARNKHINFKLELERNVTIITGDSGTGKTKLINMVRQYSDLGKQSGVSLSCDKECIVLEGKNWERILENTHDSVVFIEESTSFLKSHEFSRIIQNTDNYYVIVTREPLPQIPYSIDSIKQNNGKRVLVIADAAALGSEIRAIEKYREMSADKIDLFLPESFEWLILNSDIFISNNNVKDVLKEPVKYIESAVYFSWERFFEHLLVETTKNSKDLRYRKTKLSDGYLTDENQEMIINSMK